MKNIRNFKFSNELENEQSINGIILNLSDEIIKIKNSKRLIKKNVEIKDNLLIFYEVRDSIISLGKADSLNRILLDCNSIIDKTKINNLIYSLFKAFCHGFNKSKNNKFNLNINNSRKSVWDIIFYDIKDESVDTCIPILKNWYNSDQRLKIWLHISIIKQTIKNAWIKFHDIVFCNSNFYFDDSFIRSDYFKDFIVLLEFFEYIWVDIPFKD